MKVTGQYPPPDDDPSEAVMAVLWVVGIGLMMLAIAILAGGLR